MEVHILSLQEGVKKTLAYVFWVDQALCSLVALFDPNSDYKQRRIYYSIRKSGVYRSVDLTNWKLTNPWIEMDQCLPN